MKLLNFVKFGESVISEIERSSKTYKIEEKDIDELGKFLKTVVAKSLDDFGTLERVHLFCKLFLVHERITEKPPKKGRGSPKGIPYNKKENKDGA